MEGLAPITPKLSAQSQQIPETTSEIYVHMRIILGTVKILHRAPISQASGRGHKLNGQTTPPRWTKDEFYIKNTV